VKGRIFSTVLLIAIVTLTLVFLGAEGGLWLLTVVALLAQRELYQLLRAVGAKPLEWMGLAIGALVILGAYYRPEWADGADVSTLAFGLGVVLLTLVVVLDKNRKQPDKAIVPTLFGLVYVPFMLSFFARVIERYTTLFDGALPGLLLAVWIVVAAKSCDIGALLTGKLIGRRKMALTLSPGKTWEGTAGGVVFSALLGGLYAWLARDSLPPDFTPLLAALLAVPVAVTSVLSDLLESHLKRFANIKDSGHMLPGIGGALDLTDSLLLTAPVGYCLLLIAL